MNLTRKKLRAEIEMYLREREDPGYRLKSFRRPKWVVNMVYEYDAYTESVHVLVVVRDSVMVGQVDTPKWRKLRNDVRSKIRIAVEGACVSFRPESEHRELVRRQEEDG